MFYVLTVYVFNDNLHFYLLPALLIVHRPCFIINVYALSVKTALNVVQVWWPTRTVLSAQVCQHVSWITSGLWEPECSIFGLLGSMHSSFGLNFGGWDRAMLRLMSWPFVCLLTLERMRVSAGTASRSCPGYIALYRLVACAGISFEAQFENDFGVNLEGSTRIMRYIQTGCWPWSSLAFPHSETCTNYKDRTQSTERNNQRPLCMFQKR